jgi:hypothetical protein
MTNHINYPKHRSYETNSIIIKFSDKSYSSTYMTVKQAKYLYTSHYIDGCIWVLYKNKQYTEYEFKQICMNYWLA